MKSLLRGAVALGVAILLSWVALSDSVQALSYESKQLQTSHQCESRSFDQPSERLSENVEEAEGRETKASVCATLLSTESGSQVFFEVSQESSPALSADFVPCTALGVQSFAQFSTPPPASLC